jgi:hypothetical protein
MCFGTEWRWTWSGSVRNDPTSTRASRNVCKTISHCHDVDVTLDALPVILKQNSQTDFFFLDDRGGIF